MPELENSNDSPEIKRLPLLEQAPSLVKIGIGLEIVLLLISLIWIWVRAIDLPIRFELRGLLLGILLTAPTLLLGKLIDELSLRYPSFLGEFQKFKSALIEPLCLSFTIKSAFVIALLSGFAEEIFFRCALYVELSRAIGDLGAFVLASAVFALVHFGFAVKDFPAVTAVYFLFACYLQGLFLLLDDIFPIAVAHAFHNFFTIMTIKRTAGQGGQKQIPSS